MMLIPKLNKIVNVGLAAALAIIVVLLIAWISLDDRLLSLRLTRILWTVWGCCVLTCFAWTVIRGTK
jgi:hypothetical protein